MLANLFLLFSILTASYSQFCVSKCKASDSINCKSTGPYDCTNCASIFYQGNNCNSFYTTNLSLVEYETSANISSIWNISTNNAGAINCAANFSHILWYFTYSFYYRLVGGDYIYRNVPITVPHYQIQFRFSIAYIGVWWPKDYLWLHMDDGIQTYDVNLSYSCVAGTNTDFICNLASSENHIDCLQNYEYTYNHNTTNMLFNFTSVSTEINPNIRFWNLFDFMIVAVTCDISCASCYANTPTSCYSCANGYYMVPNNTCLSACTTSLYLLPNPTNSLTGECLSSCPQGYYAAFTTINVCLPCAAGCLSCSSSTFCLIYDPSTSSSSNLWKQYMAVWIIVIILGLFIIASVVWRLCFYTKPIQTEAVKVAP